jgi:hypothetical protein
MTYWVKDTEVQCKYKLCVNYKRTAKRFCCGGCAIDDYDYNRLKNEAKDTRHKKQKN